MTLETSTLRRTVFGFLAVSVFAWLVAWRDPEPLHLGLPLHFWLGQFETAPDSRHPATDSAMMALSESLWPELRQRLTARERLSHRVLLRLQRLTPRVAAPHSPIETRRRLAVQIARNLNPQLAPILPELLQAFRLTRDQETRDTIGRSWIELGAQALPSLSVLVLDPDPVVRAEAIHILGSVLMKMPTDEPGSSHLAVGLASTLLADEDAVVLATLRALSYLGAHATPMTPVLIERLAHNNPEIRVAAASALGQIARKNDRCVVPLARCLTDPVPEVRAAAATALAQTGPLAVPGIPQLANALEEGPASVTVAAVHALGRIGPEANSTVPRLAARLHPGTNPSIVRSSAATALGRISRCPERAVPALIQALEDPDENVRQSAMRALAAFGPHAKTAVPALIRALAHASESIRILATEALGSIGPGARPAVPFLHAARNNNQSVMTSPVLAAVARIDVMEDTLPAVGFGETSP
jgi:HEAT repeat protein